MVRVVQHFPEDLHDLCSDTTEMNMLVEDTATTATTVTTATAAAAAAGGGGDRGGEGGERMEGDMVGADNATTTATTVAAAGSGDEEGEGGGSGSGGSKRPRRENGNETDMGGSVVQGRESKVGKVALAGDGVAGGTGMGAATEEGGANDAGDDDEEEAIMPTADATAEDEDEDTAVKETVVQVWLRSHTLFGTDASIMNQPIKPVHSQPTRSREPSALIQGGYSRPQGSELRVPVQPGAGGRHGPTPSQLVPAGRQYLLPRHHPLQSMGLRGGARAVPTTRIV